MADFTHTLTYRWQGPGKARSIEDQVEQTGSAQLSIDEDIADGQTDVEIACVLDVSEIKALYIVSSQDITLETNNGASPTDSLSLKADEPVMWHADSLEANLLTTDVTALFVTNASGASANLQIECLYDSTP